MSSPRKRSSSFLSSEGFFQANIITIIIILGLLTMHVFLSPDFDFFFATSTTTTTKGYFYHNLLPDHAKLLANCSTGKNTSSSLTLCNARNSEYNSSLHPSKFHDFILSTTSNKIKNKNKNNSETDEPSSRRCYTAPTPLLFDHPEPNYQSKSNHWIGEYFSTFTVIPVAGFLLLATAIRHDYPIILCALYCHVLIMYTGAFFSHITLIPDAFRATVTGVVWNSLLAFYFLGDLVPVLIAPPSSSSTTEKPTTTTKKPLLIAFPWLRRLLAVVGSIFSALTIQYLPEFIGPNGGFVTLSIVQPPFVFLGLVSAIYMKFFAPTGTTTSTSKNTSENEVGLLFQRFHTCPAVNLVYRSGQLLMLAMVFSAVECWIDPLLIPFQFNGSNYNFPLMHTIIHIVEQVGIYCYGVGAAGLHFYYVEGRGGEGCIDGDVELIFPSSSPSSEFVLLPFVKVHSSQTQQECLEKAVENLLKRKNVSNNNEKNDDEEEQIPVDLLSRAFRADPQSFYLSDTTQFNSTRFKDTVVTAAHENKVKCVFDPELIEKILRNDKDFSSNPFGGDESRYIGLSTTSIQLHAQHVSLIAPFFNEQRLREMAPVFSEIAQKMAHKTFSSNEDNDEGKNTKNNLVWYAYRVVIANALASFGIDKDEILNNIDSLVDFVVKSSLDMVAAVAPLGGSGTRRRLTPRSLFRIFKSLLIATPSTLKLIFFSRLGFAESWKLFRPDTSVLLPLIGFDPSGGRNIRSSILHAPEAFESAPGYFLFLEELWKKQVMIMKTNKNENDDNNKNNIFVSLQKGVDEGRLMVAEGLAIVAQLLIGMTAANGLVSCLKRLLSTEERNLLKTGRMKLRGDGNDLFAQQELEEYLRPLSDDDVLNVFDSENSLSMFITEVLRVDAPLQRMPRRVIRNCLLDGKHYLEEDDQLLLMIGSANFSTSSSKFNFPSHIRPYTNEVDRNEAMTKSFTFGRGLHRCVGMKLTHMDIESGIEGFLKYVASSTSSSSNNNATAVNLGEVVVESRRRDGTEPTKKIKFEEIGEMLDDIDVGNYGHRVLKVAI